MEERGWWEQEHGCTWGLRGRSDGGGEWGGKKRRSRSRCPPHLASAPGHNFHLNNSSQPTFPCKLQSWRALQRPGEPRGWPVACFAEGSPPAPGHKELNVFKAGFRSNQSGLALTWDRQRMGGGGELVISTFPLSSLCTPLQLERKLEQFRLFPQLQRDLT